MQKAIIPVFLVLALALFPLYSKAITNTIEPPWKDNTVIAFEVESISLMRKGFYEPVNIEPGDIQAIIDLLNSAEYDHAWNDSGIMVKMIENDFTFSIKYQNNQETTVLLWTDGFKVKSNGNWYIINPQKGSELLTILYRYIK